MSKRWNSYLTGILRITGRSVAALLIVQLLSGGILSPQRFVFFPIYAEEQLGYSAVVISMWVAAGQFLGMLAAIISGAVGDKVGHKWTLLLGLVGFVLGSLIYLVSTPWLMFVFWAAGGLGQGFHAVGGQGYLIESAGSKHLGVLSALYNWGFTLGGALGSAVGGIILDQHGFIPFGMTMLIVSLATVMGAAAFLPTLRPSTQHQTASLVGSLTSYRQVVRQPAVAILSLMRFLPTCYWGMAAVLIPLLVNRGAESKTAVALYATTSQILASLAQIGAGQAADRWGAGRPTLIAFSVLTSSIFGLALTGNELWGLFLFGTTAACAAWSLSTLMPTLVSIAASAEERGRVLGALHLLWNLAMMVGAVIGGSLLSIAVGLPFFVAGLLNLGALALTMLFFRTVALRTAGSLAND
jgi:MFS family permease